MIYLEKGPILYEKLSSLSPSSTSVEKRCIKGIVGDDWYCYINDKCYVATRFVINNENQFILQKSN